MKEIWHCRILKESDILPVSVALSSTIPQVWHEVRAHVAESVVGTEHDLDMRCQLKNLKVCENIAKKTWILHQS